MTGEELYAIYAEAMAGLGVGMDEFEDLEVDDRIAWETVARKVQEVPD